MTETKDTVTQTTLEKRTGTQTTLTADTDITAQVSKMIETRLCRSLTVRTEMCSDQAAGFVQEKTESKDFLNQISV